MANDPHFFSPHPLSESPNELALEPGVLLGNKYRLLRHAGFGGMGAVWVARNEATAAEVAVKVLVTARQGVDQEAIARFRREAHTAAQLYHRGIVRIFDLVELSFPREDAESAVRHAGASSGRSGSSGSAVPDALVLVMELLRGETLASLMDKRRRFSQEESLGIVLPLLSALAHAHAQGIVHRDLKPENVFLSVDPDGHVIPKILDFGISKLLQPAAPRITTDGAMLGTPNYMSPEQARGLANVDARADVFAMGILLYECLSGENPFASGSYHSVVAAILERDPPPLSTDRASPALWRVIKRALEKPAALRYADAGELAGALGNAAQSTAQGTTQAAAPVTGVAAPESSGSYPSQGRGQPSIGDRSVPPAPFREQELTIPSLFVQGKRRKRKWATLGAAALAIGLAGAAGLYARSGRSIAAGSNVQAPPAPSAEPDVVVSPASAHAQTSGAAATPTTTTGTSPAPEAIVPVVSVSALPSPAAVPPVNASAPAPPHAHAPSPARPASTHARAAPPAPPTAPTAPTAAPAPPPAVVRGVARDPGF